MDGIHKVKNDFWKLRDLYENHSIGEFQIEFMRISDSYLDTDFDPDAFFPNKVDLKRRVNAIIDELRTVKLLAGKNVDASEYISNMEHAIMLCLSIKGMKWIKEKPEWTIPTDEIRIMEEE